MPSLREQLKGFPVFQLVVVNIMRFGEPLSFSSLFPYVYYMIRDFKIASTEEEISTYSGYLAASFSFTQFLFSIYWGKLSDKIGRKKVVMIGLVGTSISMLIFGFSPNFYVALGARSFLGAVNGNVAVVRTIIAEQTTDRNHQAIAFSTFPLLWNIGSIIGPLIGGSKWFTRPKQHNPYDPVTTTGFSEVHNEFLNRYPYALSNVVIALFLWVGTIVGFLFLQETHYKVKNQRDYGLDIGDWILKKLGYTVPVRPWHSRETLPLLNDVESSSSNDSADITEPQPLFDDVEDDDDDQSIESNIISRRTSISMIRRYSSISLTSNKGHRQQLRSTISRVSGVSLSRQETRDLENSTWGEIFTSPVRNTILGNFLLSFHNVVYSEFLPVFLARKIIVEKLKFPFKISGGFGLDSDSIGNLISVTGLIGVFVVIIIFPYLDRNYKTVNNYRFSALIFPIIYFCLPFFIFTLHEYNSKFSPTFTKHLLYFNGMVYQLASATAFPQILLLIHRAAPARHRAFINGTALSINALSRFLAPVIWGYLMSYFDYIGYSGFTWFLLAGISMIGSVQSWFLADYDEDLK